MSRNILHQSGLGTPDKALGDGTDGGGGEKRVRGIGLAEIGAQKCRGCLPKEVGAPETGIRRNSDLLTPQGKDLNPWYLKTGLTATAMSILTRSGSLSSGDFLRCGGQERTVSPVDVTVVRRSQLTYCVEVAAELLADVEEQTVRSVHQAQRAGRESPQHHPGARINPLQRGTDQGPR